MRKIRTVGATLLFGSVSALAFIPIGAAPAVAQACDPNYTGACVPVFPPDVDCADVGVAVNSVGNDPHGLDADDDGIGCDEFGTPAPSPTAPPAGEDVTDDLLPPLEPVTPSTPPTPVAATPRFTG